MSCEKKKPIKGRAFRHQISRRTNRRIANCAFSVIFGIVVLIFFNVATEALPYVAGSVCLAWGALCFVGLILTLYHLHPSLLVQAVAFISLGIITICSPNLFTEWVLYVLAIYLGGRAVTNFIYAAQIKRGGIDHWWIELAYGILLLAFAIISIVLDVLELEGNAGIIIAGVMLILGGVLGVAPIFTYMMAKKKIYGYFDGPLIDNGANKQ